MRILTIHGTTILGDTKEIRVLPFSLLIKSTPQLTAKMRHVDVLSIMVETAICNLQGSPSNGSPTADHNLIRTA
jgi:hypothetical protein